MREKVLKAIRKTENLPVLPRIMQQVLNMIQSGDYSAHELGEVIKKDPGISAKLIKVANSPLFNPSPREITSIERAVVVLGAKNIVPLVVGLSVTRFLDIKDEEFGKELFWKHSFTCAHISKRLAGFFGLDPADAFTVGLLHDLGKIVLYINFPDEYLQVKKLVEERNVAFFEAEKEVFGIDHSEVGEFLFNFWKMPGVIRDSVRYHHRVSEAKDNVKMVALCHLANLFSRTYGVYYGEDTFGIDLFSDEGWQILTKDMDFEAEELIFSVEEEVERAIEFAKIAWSET